MADIDPVSARGRSPGASWQDLLAEDSRPVPAFLSEDHYRPLGDEPIPVERYTSERFAAMERERLWPHVWQFAAREEDFPEAGDYTVFENAGRSWVLVRQADGSVRAFHNVCLHRGRKLKTQDGWANQLQCPFHGFAWNMDGSLKHIPCRWDFPHLDAAEMQLPEAEVGRWAGYVFLRETPGGPSLMEFLAPLPEHFARWRHEECVTVIWVAKEVPANWKATCEAFLEAWHTVVTHPQLLPFTGDSNSAYEVLGEHTNVNFVPFATISPHVDPTDKPEQWIVDEFIKFNGRSADNYEGGAYAVTVPEGVSARVALGQSMRETYATQTGYDHDHATDSELLDALVYNVFPNFGPWGGFMPNIVYRWKPGVDADHCLMEVRILSRVKKGEPMPRGVPMKLLGREQKWTEAPDLGVLGDVFEQDMENLPYVQEGMKASKTGHIQLARYQEIRIRHFNRLLEQYLGLAPGA